MAASDDYRRESRARWGAQAAGWEARRDVLRQVSMPVSAWMVDAIDPQPGDTVLELAAGTGDTGFLAAELIQPGGTLISSDFAPEMLSVAQRRAAELGIANVRFKQIDAESIDVDAASLDGVLCRWGYMLMADSEAALRETRRVLKPDARVAFAAWTTPEDNPWAAIASRSMLQQGLLEPPDPTAPGQFAWGRLEAIQERLDDAGFVDHRVEPLDFAYEFGSFDDYWATMADFSNWFAEALRTGDPATVAEARAAAQAAVEPFARADGSLVLPARTWVGWAGA
ncbi:MAG TPA: methyltransferase domain-containing protein [Solirubrobacteraceae bacterium]|nr:methyltransferase domain-containing protein [Solirubrobacteraceae bacterium]